MKISRSRPAALHIRRIISDNNFINTMIIWSPCFVVGHECRRSALQQLELFCTGSDESTIGPTITMKSTLTTLMSFGLDRKNAIRIIGRALFDLLIGWIDSIFNFLDVSESVDVFSSDSYERKKKKITKNTEIAALETNRPERLRDAGGCGDCA